MKKSKKKWRSGKFAQLNSEFQRKRKGINNVDIL